MSEPFLGQITCYGFNFAPQGWALCQGQTLPISQNTALFSLLGVNFGGDGRTTFNLPNLQGIAPLGQGQGAGLSFYSVGEQAGEANVTLNSQELPAHSHAFNCTTDLGTTPSASGKQQAKSQKGGGISGQISAFRFSPNSPTTTLAPTSVTPAGQGGAHNNMQPYLALNFCIALQGIFPQRQ